MGLAIEKAAFTEQEYSAFNTRLRQNLQSLRGLLGAADFGVGAPSVGAELELYIVDDKMRPALLNTALVQAFEGDQLTLELNRYNIEYNSKPHPVRSANPFTAIEFELNQMLKQLNRLADGHRARIAAIGILPTLRRGDFGAEVMTDEFRFKALTEGLLRLRQGHPFDIHIDGPEPIQVETDNVTYEGANTSFQFHYQVAPRDFANIYNAIQLVTPVALALAANSPLLLGHKLWHETRIPLFKQSVDCRDPEHKPWHLPSRVTFGHGWIRNSAYQLFAEAVRLYPPLLPVCGEQQSSHVGPPPLYELRLHEGTVWYWNRPVYDPSGDGSLRIEIRTLPAGPSVPDMIANAAFIVGVAEALRDDIEEYLSCLPFRLARHNFYEAAEKGMQAKLVWPDLEQSTPREMPVTDIARQLLGRAAQGLRKIGVDAGEAQRFLSVIEKRLKRSINGSAWQLQTLAHFEKDMPREQALEKMMERYLLEQQSGRCVADWRLP